MKLSKLEKESTLKKVVISSQKKLFLYFEKWKFLEKLLIIQEGTF